MAAAGQPGKRSRYGASPYRRALPNKIVMTRVILVSIKGLLVGLRWRDSGAMDNSIFVVLFSLAMSLLVGWLVGNTLTARLEREKLTERDVAALSTFQELYGEFFSTWKMWGNSALADKTRDQLLSLAAKLEGRYEALLVMVCSDRLLSDDDTRALGAMRQGLQQLREAIKQRRNIDWWSSEDESYRAFKLLAIHVAVLLRPRTMRWAGRSPDRPNAAVATESLRAVTSNEFEHSWVKVAQSLAAAEGGADYPESAGT